MLIYFVIISSIILTVSYNICNSFNLINKGSKSYFSSCSSIHRKSTHKIYSSNDDTLLDQMRKTLGDREDLLDNTEKENKQLLQGLRDLDRDPDIKLNNKLLEWLDSNGVYIKTTSTWGRAPHPLVIASKTEDDGESCGRGLLAREPMTEGELLMTIPLDICLTRAVSQEILGKLIVPDSMDEYLAIALLLMSERLKGSESRWKPYIDILPSTKDVYPSFTWPEEELELLKGSPIYYASNSLKSKLAREYKDIKESIFMKFPTKFPLDQYTYDLFIWAFVMLLSRAARLSSKSTGEELALVPYADLMNHSPYSNTYIDAQRSGLPFVSRTEEVALYADRNYKKFEQVFINYGEKSNADLLLLYGFALEKNPFNAVGLSKDDPLYNQKKLYLDKSGRGAQSVRFPLQLDRYPSELVDFLRLLLVEPEDLGFSTIDRIDFNEPISPSLERRVLTTMISICESYLNQYPTTIQEDELLISDKMLFSTLSRQQRMAIKLRISEKRILQQTIKAVDDELLRLPAIVVDDQKIIPAGRSFETLDTQKSLSKNPTYNTWVDIRETKEKDVKNNEKESKPSIAERRRKRRTE